VDRYEAAADYADRIEAELRNLAQWQSEPMPAAAYESDQAFYADTMTYFQWLQFVLVPRINEIVAERGKFPAGSMTGAYAVRYFDGFDDAYALITLLSEFDEFSEGRRSGRALIFTPIPAAPAVEPAPPPTPPPAEPPLAVAERYWRTRDAALLTSNPSSRASFDTQLAEQVFSTATGFVEFAGEPEDIPEGVSVRTVIEAERGAWVVLTALTKDQGQWRVNLPLSIARTTEMFLGMHRARGPYTEVEDARGRAMLFWEQVLHRNERWARELCVPESVELPQYGAGQMDEFIWYIAYLVDGPRATVRVLMNTHAECRTLLTQMVQRDGRWLVDLAATLGQS
jgi:uncharacterized protein YqcC (DUF446 family)